MKPNSELWSETLRGEMPKEKQPRREIWSRLWLGKGQNLDITTRQDQEIKKLQQERDLLKARLQSAEIQPIVECQEQVRSCQAIRELKEK